MNRGITLSGHEAAVQKVLAQHGLLRIAHRGASATAPENTMHAFRQAIADGADMIELDVRLSKDGSLVILHDEYLNRTTSGCGLVCETHVDEIRRLDAGSWFQPQFAGARVPTLEEVLSQFPDTCFNVELKTFPLHRCTELVEGVLKAIAEAGAWARVLISSFDHAALQTARALSPDVLLGALYCGRLWSPFALAEDLQLTSFHPDVASLEPLFIAEAQARGYHVLTWTVRSLEMLEWSMMHQVDGVILDDVKLGMV
ncbi:glycerophosphodiester phosphodiesterase [Alicyclobacillus fastidiosus]|uniref:Glycerophosphodiester phosphodiesterase family protein n=1 Tax=Alicyclobacillus fastidiosus TaxID=392011 RepID=A0ABV5AEF0_9BACL|nr:glycerophosphodiester phosphodiesterase family protein [Alicyclobacillus fastidiosus]WEH09782.1 glycerophosphodiester phosphodiesterase family protein [Alicyclobacillus fastidiosus]